MKKNDPIFIDDEIEKRFTSCLLRFEFSVLDKIINYDTFIGSEVVIVLCILNHIENPDAFELILTQNKMRRLLAFSDHSRDESVNKKKVLYDFHNSQLDYLQDYKGIFTIFK